MSGDRLYEHNQFFGAKIARSRELYVKLQYLLEEYVRGVSVVEEVAA